MFDMVGLSEFAKEIHALYGNVEEISEQLLEKGAVEVEKLWKSELKKNVMKRGTICQYGRTLRSGKVQRITYLSRSTGAMYNSVTHENFKTFADIYPKGKDEQKKPVRNATKAFVLNYGRGKGGGKARGGFEGKHYVDGNGGINDRITDVAIPAMQNEFNKILKQKGLVNNG